MLVLDWFRNVAPNRSVHTYMHAYIQTDVQTYSTQKYRH